MSVSDKAVIARLELELANLRISLHEAQETLKLRDIEIQDLKTKGTTEVQRLKNTIEELEYDYEEAHQERDRALTELVRLAEHHKTVVGESLYLLTKLEMTLRAKVKST